MEIKTLKGVSAARLAQIFNEAFSDYLLPIALTENDMSVKMAAENTVLENSAGAFSDGKLVGFILIGIEKQTAYNGGTGVIPAFRGQNLTRRMYGFLLPHLAGKGISNHLLEVMVKNAKALPVYQKIGFEIARTVTCFKGQVGKTKSAVAEIRPIKFDIFEAFWDFRPTYQNKTAAILRTADLHRSFGAFVDGNLIGYITFSEANGRIKQFAVKAEFRGKGIGRQLFYEVQKAVGEKTITLINVDDSDGSIAFLEKIGFEDIGKQYEMAYHYTESH